MPHTMPPRRHCAECGAVFQPKRKSGQYCGPACRNAWVNRRKDRGAIAYDFIMALRFDREVSGELDFWKILCRLTQEWRTDDIERRGGRPSFLDPANYIAARPYLRADRVLTSQPKRGSMAVAGKGV